MCVGLFAPTKTGLRGQFWVLCCSLKIVFNSYFVGHPHSRLIVQQRVEWSLNKRVCVFFTVCLFVFLSLLF